MYSQVGVDPEKFYVPKWQDGVMDVTDLQVSCEMPQTLGSIGNSAAFIIDDAVSLVNAIVVAQNFSNFSDASIFIRQNITFSDLYEPNQLVPQIPIGINLTISAVDGSIQTIIDWNLVLWVFSIYSPSVTLTFNGLYMMNISPMRGLIVPSMGYLPLFSVPLWVIW